MNKALPEIAEHYPDAGILVCLSTIEEVLRFANEVQGGVRIYGSASEQVIVGDEGFLYRAKSHSNKPGKRVPISDSLNPTLPYTEAPIIVLTQAMLEQRMKTRKDFADLDALKFHGRTRLVKVWDESLIPAYNYTLSAEYMSSIWGVLSEVETISNEKNNSPISVVVLKEVLQREVVNPLLELDLAKGEAVAFQMPDLDAVIVQLCCETHYEEVGGAAFWDALELCKSRQEKNTLLALLRASGKEITVSRGDNQNYVLNYNTTITDDFLPVLVLDASGVIRKTYDAFQERGWTVQRLLSPKKDFSNATFIHREVATGIKAWRDNTTDRAEWFADQINANKVKADGTPRKFLLVEKRERKKNGKTVQLSYAKEVKKRLDPDVITETIYWGSSKAVADNSLRDFDAVVLLCLLNYDPIDYQIMKAMCMNKPIHKVSGRHADEFVCAEKHHHAHQVINRTNIRKNVDGTCGEVLIIAASHKQDKLGTFFGATYGCIEKGGTNGKTNVTRHVSKTTRTNKATLDLRKVLLDKLKEAGKVTNQEFIALSPNKAKSAPSLFAKRNAGWIGENGIRKTRKGFFL
jgi:hypothetical protein